MNRFFNKLSRVVLVAALAGVTTATYAGDRGGNKSSSKSFRSSGGNKVSTLKLSNLQAPKVQKSNVQSQKVSNFKPIKQNVKNPVGNKSSQPLIKTLPKQGLGKKVVTPGKITKFPGSEINHGPLVGKQGPLAKSPFPNGKPPVLDPKVPFPGGKPPVLDPKIPFPGGKPPVLDPKVPFPGGKPPVLDPKVPFPGGKPPVLDPKIPFPGGKPPVLDPMIPFPGGGGNGGGGNGGGGNGGGGNGGGGNGGGGNGGGGNGGGGNGDPGNGDPGNGDPGNGDPGNGGAGNGGNHNDHCQPRCPWPIFWPVYTGGYWNNPGYCATPTVIVNEVPPVVVNEVRPIAAVTPVEIGTNHVDLVLEDIQYVEPATMLVGPAYRVKFRNQGLATAGGFRIAIVASVNGAADEKSPMALVDVAGLASGQSSEVTVRLPRTAMQMTTADGQGTAFTHLLVAADFDNLISEADKANNVAIVDRQQLEVAVK